MDDGEGAAAAAPAAAAVGAAAAIPLNNAAPRNRNNMHGGLENDPNYPLIKAAVKKVKQADLKGVLVKNNRDGNGRGGQKFGGGGRSGRGSRFFGATEEGPVRQASLARHNVWDHNANDGANTYRMRKMGTHVSLLSSVMNN